MRLIVVSNRLPVSICKKQGRYIINNSIGGVAVGLNQFLSDFQAISEQNKIFWIGWPGEHLENNLALVNSLKEINCYPVSIPPVIMNHYYLGFCNKTIWPLFHGMPYYHQFSESAWFSYQTVNQIFFNKIIEIFQPGDMLWIHDYHLLLLPELLKNFYPNASIGFFLHISFPSNEMIRILPKYYRKKLLSAILHADLIGFHTHEYCKNFLAAVKRNLGYDHILGSFHIGNRISKVNVYPMGVPINLIQERANSMDIIKQKYKLNEIYKNHKIILSVDRLDYTKAIINRLFAYDEFLDKNPQWLGRVILMLLVAPSREGIEDYETLKNEINRLVGTINGKYGNIYWTPVIYQYKVFSLDELISYYSVSHVAIVTPIQDGMNLIAKEYVASRIDKKGVLILSENAGSAKELADAIIVNPYSRGEIVRAIIEALNMPEYEQARRIIKMQYILKKNSIRSWGVQFLTDLKAMKQHQHTKPSLSRSQLQSILATYQSSMKRLFLLDYDGTLVPFFNRFDQANPNEHLIKLITDIAENKNNKVVIISGRSKETVEKWLGHLAITLVAECNAWIKDKEWRGTNHFINDWKPQIHAILQTYVDQLPGSYIEEKEYSIVWHYRETEEDKADEVSKELFDYLMLFTHSYHLKLESGNKIIEIKSPGIGKDVAIREILSKENFDFILALGDDVSDEDMFRQLPEHAISIKVGMEHTHAKFHLSKQADVMELLKSF